MIQSADRINVERLMREIEDEVRRARRTRLLRSGGASEYEDPDVFALVERTLRRAIDEQDRDVLLLPQLFSDAQDWQLDTHLRFSSHRPIVGPWIVFLKRRLLLPMMRWLYEYSLENFRRQERVNRMLFACVEQLAIENARLRKMAGLQGELDSDVEGSKADDPAKRQR